MDIAKSITGLDNITEAVKSFRKLIHSPSMYFNQELFPKNESNERAYRKCSNEKGKIKHLKYLLDNACGPGKLLGQTECWGVACDRLSEFTGPMFQATTSIETRIKKRELYRIQLILRGFCVCYINFSLKKDEHLVHSSRFLFLADNH